MSIKQMTPEHKAKITAARNAYWARYKAEKAAREAEELANPKPKVEKPFAAGSIFEPAKNQPATTDDEAVDVGQARHHIIKQINQKRKKLIEAQIDVATGLYYVANDGKHVYTQKPNAAVGEYLLNQLIGKPKESIEVKSVRLNIDL